MRRQCGAPGWRLPAGVHSRAPKPWTRHTTHTDTPGGQRRAPLHRAQGHASHPRRHQPYPCRLARPPLLRVARAPPTAWRLCGLAQPPACCSPCRRQTPACWPARHGVPPHSRNHHPPRPPLLLLLRVGPAVPPARRQRWALQRAPRQARRQSGPHGRPSWRGRQRRQRLDWCVCACVCVRMHARRTCEDEFVTTSTPQGGTVWKGCPRK